jgi:hypothetical protein
MKLHHTAWPINIRHGKPKRQLYQRFVEELRGDLGTSAPRLCKGSITEIPDVPKMASRVIENNRSYTV